MDIDSEISQEIEKTSNTSSPIPILRELRKHLLLDITNGERRIGESNEIKSWMLRKYQENPCVADMMRGILMAKTDLLLANEDLPTLSRCMSSLPAIEKRPLPEFSFASSILQGENVGVLIQREKLEGGGLIYSISIFDRQSLTNSLRRLEIRASEKEPEPFLSVLSDKGYFHVSKDEIHQFEIGMFALKCLVASHNYIFRKIPVDRVVDNRLVKPKPNNHLVQLIAQAYRGEIKSSKVSVPLELIEPRDIDYALKVHEEQIQHYIDETIKWKLPHHELLLYEKDGCLIMDDDYLPYLAYRALKLSSVPAVIIGEFNQPQVKVIEEGYGELVPPIGVTKINDQVKIKKSKNELLDEKLSSLKQNISVGTRLENLFVQFCRLLGDKTILERELHNFIQSNPEFLDSHIAAIYSEVKIGRYRADLVLRYNQTDKRIVLVELKRHCDKIFTKTNKLRKKVDSAQQQVEDWIRQIRLNTENIPEWLEGTYEPEGAIVIGRSKDLTEEQKEILFSNNSNRLVKVLTYDDLLERVIRLINTIEQHSASGK